MHVSRHVYACVQEISTLLWALATVGMASPALMAAVAAHLTAPEVIAGFRAPTIATIAWAFAKLGVRDVALMEALARRLLQPGMLESLQPHELVNVACAWATLGVAHPALTSAMAAWVTTSGTLGDFSAKNVASLAWAYAKLQACAVTACVPLPPPPAGAKPRGEERDGYECAHDSAPAAEPAAERCQSPANGLAVVVLVWGHDRRERFRASGLTRTDLRWFLGAEVGPDQTSCCG